MATSRAAWLAQADYSLPLLPWSALDVTRLARTTGVGALGLGVAWYGASGEAREADQLWWLTLAVAATALAALAMVGWLVTGFRQVRQTARANAADIAKACSLRRDDHLQVAGNGPDPGVWTSSPAMTRYHVSTCQLIQGKPDLYELQPQDIVQRRLNPCGVCLDV